MDLVSRVDYYSMIPDVSGVDYYTMVPDVSRMDYYSMVPDEIFLHIFRNLPLEDRKSVRSTCRRFYELCNDSRMQATEVFAFYGILNTDAALRSLFRSSRKIQNIKLTHARLNTEAILLFFEQHGPHVRSLDFRDCSFDPGALKTVIENCVSLRHFALEFSLSVDYDNVLNDFAELVTNSIVRKCVTDFSLIVSSSSWRFSNRKFLNFFAVFPGITKLCLNIRVAPWSDYFCAFEQCSTISSDVSTDSSFTFSCIYDRLLALADQLEVLKLNFECGIPKNIFDIRMKNLKQLSVSWFYDLPDIPAVYHSSLFEQLTQFDCSIDSGREPETTYLVVKRLLQFPPLQSLTVADCAVMDVELFQAMVESKLKTLEIRRVSYRGDALSVGDLRIKEPSSFQNTLTPNYYLQHLVIEECDNDLTLLFATYFRSVNHLKFSEVHEGVLRNILEDQTNIRSLRLGNLASDGIFKELSYFQDWLRIEKTIDREFKYLTELRVEEEKYCLTNFLLSEFIFPKLKSLSIAMRKLDEGEEKQLCHLIAKLPQLESLILVLSSQMIPSRWSSLCEGLSKLRHLHVVNDSEFLTQAEYVRLFAVSPSLRTVVHCSRLYEWYEAVYFFNDLIQKTVIHVQEEDIVFAEICSFISLMTIFRRSRVSEVKMYDVATVTPDMARRVLPYLAPHIPCLNHVVLDRKDQDYCYCS